MSNLIKKDKEKDEVPKYTQQSLKLQTLYSKLLNVSKFR